MAKEVGTVFLFPGQGAQAVGMGEDLFEAEASARRIFEEADRVFGFALSRLCFQGPPEELTRTQNCQPAILTASIAALEVLKLKLPQVQPAYTAGLSLGEYSALVAAGILEFKDALVLVRKRGEFMEDAAQKNPGGMVCLFGLDQETVQSICAETGCEVANLNCPGQIIVSGKHAGLGAASEMAKARGVKRVIQLDVSGAFHSSLMDEASQKLAEEIEKVEFRQPSCPLVSNVDATQQTDPVRIKANLIKQVNSTTYWEASMRYLLSRGVGQFLEIGPGTVLRGLFRKIDPSAPVVNLGNLTDFEEVSIETSR